jgi:hypothetical protein
LRRVVRREQLTPQETSKLTKSTRLALAIVGVVIIVVAAVAIGTGKNEQQATPVHEQEHAAGGASGATHEGGATAEYGGGTGDVPKTDESGGAAPGSPDDGDQSGGAAPQEESGGASADVVSPLLTPEKPRTIKVKKGQTVLIRARSGKAATLHVHGYEEMTVLTPGKLGELKFTASMDGEYEIEFHFDGSQTSAGILRVSP